MSPERIYYGQFSGGALLDMHDPPHRRDKGEHYKDTRLETRHFHTSPLLTVIVYTKSLMGIRVSSPHTVMRYID